jgi:transcriptional regulator with XRE-family HTH domain
MSDDRPTSPFSQSLAAVLRGYMLERGITRPALMEHMHRSKGYVAEHLNGTRPPDTDLIFAVAELANVPAWDLVEVIRRRISDYPPPSPGDGGPGGGPSRPGGPKPDEDPAQTAERIADRQITQAVEAAAAGMTKRKTHREKQA